MTEQSAAPAACEWQSRDDNRIVPQGLLEHCLGVIEGMRPDFRPSYSFAQDIELAVRQLKSAIAAAPSPAPVPPNLLAMEYGWVIEHGASEVSRPRYWGGVNGWTYDNLQAVRFSREQDALSQAESMDDGVPNNYRIAEHGWG